MPWPDPPINRTNLPDTAVPDFIAGFIEGMTGDDRQDYIRRCYEEASPDVLGPEIQAAINGLTKGGPASDLTAITSFCLFFNQFPNAL